MFSEKIEKAIKTYIVTSLSLIVVFSIYTYPEIFLKETNRSFLNSLAAKNTEIFVGAGGGNYIKTVYKEYLVTLDEDVLLDEFNITYSGKERSRILDSTGNEISILLKAF
tara:strand:- start:1413 stop:1742 length:330 start_codon:yes stop_codon:yes gene_type:complete